MSDVFVLQVLLFSPQYVVDTDESYTVTVNAIGSSERLARGNSTLSVYAVRWNNTAIRGRAREGKVGLQLLWTENTFLVSLLKI
jgi:hypothetical protein